MSTVKPPPQRFLCRAHTQSIANLYQNNQTTTAYSSRVYKNSSLKNTTFFSPNSTESLAFDLQPIINPILDVLLLVSELQAVGQTIADKQNKGRRLINKIAQRRFSVREGSGAYSTVD